MAEKKYKRKIYIINRKFQLKYTFVMLFVMVVTVLVSVFTAFYIVWNNILDEALLIPEASVRMGEILAYTTELMIIPVVILAVVFGVLGILFSHKIAGPIYRVEKVAEELGRGNLDVLVRFRKGDELQNLAVSLNEMIQNIKNMVQDEKTISNELLELSRKLQDDIADNKNMKEDVRAAVKKLNDMAKKLKKSTDRYKT